MNSTLAQDLGGVVRLLEKATPGEWRAGFMHDGEFVESTTDGGALQKGDGSFLAVSKTANGYNYQDAKAIAAAVNFLRAHSAEIAGALRDADDGVDYKSKLHAMHRRAQKAEAELAHWKLWAHVGWGFKFEKVSRAVYELSRLTDSFRAIEKLRRDRISSENSAMQQGGGGGE